MKNGLLFLALISILACEKADWERRTSPSPRYTFSSVQLFGGSEEDIAHAVISTEDGGFAVLGNTKSINGDVTDKSVEVSDLLLIKYNADGTKAWSTTYGGSQDDRGHSLVQLADGGYVLLGYSMSDDLDASVNQGQHDNWVIRVDATGQLLWEKSFGFPGHDHAYNIIATQDGGLLFNGFLDVTSSEGAGASSKIGANSARHGVGEFWVHKIDLEGNVQWRYYFGGTNNDRSYDAVETSEGSFIVVGTSESDDVDISQPRGDYDIWVVKLSASGQLVWEKSLGGSAYDGANAVILDNEENILVLGHSLSQDYDVSSPLGKADAWLAKLNPMGELLQEFTYGGTAFDLGRDLVLHQEYVWLCGYSRSVDIDLKENKGDNDVFLFQLNERLLPDQQFSLGGNAADLAHAMTILADQSIVVVGSTESTDGLFENNHGDKDVFIARWHPINE